MGKSDEPPPLAGGGRGRHRIRTIFTIISILEFAKRGVGTMAMRRAVQKLLCAASMTFIACATSDAVGDQLPAEPLVRVTTGLIVAQDSDWSSSFRCGDRLLYLSPETDNRWFAVNLVSGSTSDAYPELPYGPHDCSPSGDWLLYYDADGRAKIRASDETNASPVFEYKNALILWAENDNVLFLLRGEEWGQGGYGMTEESPISDLAPIEVFYLEPTNEKVEQTFDRYGGISVMHMIWNRDSNSILARTGNGEIVVVRFGPSRQVEALTELSLSTPVAYELALDWHVTHVAAYMAFDEARLAPLLLLADWAYLIEQSAGANPLSLLLCRVEAGHGDCLTRPWHPPRLDHIASSLQIPLKTPSPIDSAGSMIGFHETTDQTGCLAIWVGTGPEPLTCLTNDFEIKEKHEYRYEVLIRSDHVFVVWYDTDLTTESREVSSYRFMYESLRELGVDV